MKSLLPFAFLIALPTHIFAALMAFAAFSIMYKLFLETSKLYGAEETFLSTLVRSYSTSGFWGTSWASVMLVVSMFHIPWYRLILMGLVFTGVSIALNLASIKISMVRKPGRFPTLQPDRDVKVNWRKVAIMSVLALSVVLVTLVTNQISGWNLLVIVPLVSIAFPIITALVQRKKTELKIGLLGFYDKSLYKARSEVFLFTSAGLLAYALNVSGVGAGIITLIPRFLIDYPYLMIVVLMLLVIIPGQVGIHPVASGTTLLVSIEPSSIGLTIPIFSITIICAWLLSNMLSPFSALNLTISGLCGKSSWYTGLKLNWRYGLVCLFVYSAMCLLMGNLLMAT